MNGMKMQRVALVFGGPSPEHEISVLSASKVAAGLAELAQSRPLEVTPVYIDREGQWLWGAAAMACEQTVAQAEQWAITDLRDQIEPLDFAQSLSRMKAQQVDVAMLILHGACGEDGRIQGALDLMGVAYTGSGAAASSLALDKPRSQAVLNAAGLRVAPSCLIRGGEELGGAERIVKVIGLPCIVKPAHGGSSVGMTRVTEAGELEGALRRALEIEDEVMAEQFVKGREFTCGVIELEGRLQALPVTEIIPPEGRLFDYEAKYQAGVSREVTPAQIEPRLATDIQHYALAAHRALGCRGFSRTDFIADPAPPTILEVNTIPGMTATSLLPQAAAAVGIGFAQLLGVMLEAACAGRD